MRNLAVVLLILLTFACIGCRTKSISSTEGNDTANNVKYYPAPSGIRGTGYIDKTGRMVIGTIPEIIDGKPFSDGLACVKKDVEGKQEWGYIGPNGKFVIQPQYLDAKSFSEGFAWVEDPVTQQWGFIDKTGKYIIKPNLEGGIGFSEGLSAARMNGKFGFIDTKGKIVIQPRYADAGKFVDRLAPVGILEFNSTKYGFIDINGIIKIPPQYYAAGDFFLGWAPVKLGSDDRGPWSYIDKSGRMMIKPFEAIWATSFSRDGIAAVKTNPFNEPARWGFIDKSGKEIIYSAYTKTDGFDDNGIASCTIESDKLVYIDKTGKTIWEQSEMGNPGDIFKNLSGGSGEGNSSLPKIPPLYYIIAFLVSLIINSFLLSYAANYIGIEADYGRCLLASLCTLALNAISGVFFRNSSIPGALAMSLAVSAAMAIVMIKYILNADWGRAFMAYIVMIVVGFVVAFVLVCCFTTGTCLMGPN